MVNERNAGAVDSKQSTLMRPSDWIGKALANRSWGEMHTDHVEMLNGYANMVPLMGVMKIIDDLVRKGVSGLNAAITIRESVESGECDKWVPTPPNGQSIEKAIAIHRGIRLKQADGSERTGIRLLAEAYYLMAALKENGAEFVSMAAMRIQFSRLVHCITGQLRDFSKQIGDGEAIEERSGL